MNFNSSIRKAAISNHIRNRRLRIKIADNNNPVFKAIVKNKIKGKTILEIGCSTGYLLEALRSKLGAKCFGVDISSAAIKEGKKLFKKIKLYNSFFESSKLKNKKYDLIILGYFLFLLPIDKVLTLFSFTLPLTAVSNSLGRQWLMANNKDVFYSMTQLVSSIIALIIFIFSFNHFGYNAYPISLIIFELTSIFIIAFFIYKNKKRVNKID